MNVAMNSSNHLNHTKTLSPPVFPASRQARVVVSGLPPAVRAERLAFGVPFATRFTLTNRSSVAVALAFGCEDSNANVVAGSNGSADSRANGVEGDGTARSHTRMDDWEYAGGSDAFLALATGAAPPSDASFTHTSTPPAAAAFADRDNNGHSPNISSNSTGAVIATGLGGSLSQRGGRARTDLTGCATQGSVASISASSEEKGSEKVPSKSPSKRRDSVMGNGEDVY